ncbi:MAG: hypothetical protein PHV18_05140 [Lachnospiraceae bacterium]|nr:hypothetical protein [Lachnospiraceae bacterium]
MIRFILGEDRHVKYFVHSVKQEYFTIKEAVFRLIYDGEVEMEGTCEVAREEDGYSVDAKIQPLNRSRLYVMEITLRIADEVIKNREQMEVV